MNRRAALECAGVGLAVALAGYSALQSPDHPTVEVGEVVVRNRLDREVDVSVLLVDDGDVAYWRTVPVPAEPNPFASLPDLPTDAGEYALHARVAAGEGGPPTTADLTEGADDGTCITVHVEVVQGDGSDSAPRVVYGAVGECRSSS